MTPPIDPHNITAIRELDDSLTVIVTFLFIVATFIASLISENVQNNS